MFKLEYVSENSYENEFFATLKFTKGVKYFFKVANNIDDFIGEAVFELIEGDNLVLTNYLKSSDKYYGQTYFICNQTGFYDVIIKFKDNTVGYSTLDIYMIQ